MRTPTDMLCLRAGNRSVLLHLPSWRWLVLLAVALLALALLALSVGGGKLGFAGVVNTLLGEGTRLEQLTLFKIRLPRILGVVVAGAAMGLSGCLVQTLVRNRLATPDMVGVNNGASLAIIVFSLYLTVGSWPWWAAPIGAIFAALVLYALCRKPGEQGYLFVVIGIGLSELFEALGQFVMSTQALLHLSSLYLWNMGSFIAVGYSTITPIAILLLLLCPWIVYLSRSLAVLRFGPEMARGLGVNGDRVQLGILAQGHPGGGARHRHRRPRGLYRHGCPHSCLLAGERPGGCRSGWRRLAAPCCCLPAIPWSGCWPAPTRWRPAS